MIVRAAVILSLAFAAAGCSLFRGSPVPPPPPPPDASDIVDIEGQTVLQRLERGADGEITGFGPLSRARETVAAARADAAVSEHAPDALARARAALAEAESAWTSIAESPAAKPEALAAIAHHGHRARRWAGIAMAVAARESALAETERVRLQLARLEAEDERWLGVQLVPDMYGEITFAAGAASVAPDSDRVIGQIVEFLQVHPRYAVEVRGHSDDSPPSPASLRRFLREHPEAAEEADDAAAAYNRAVSLRRARTVVRALAAEGIEESRLSAMGFGASRPVADNDTAAGRRQNRRVEVLVVPALGWAGDYTAEDGTG